MTIDPAKLKEALLHLCAVTDNWGDSEAARVAVEAAFVETDPEKLLKLKLCPFCRGQGNLGTNGLVAVRFRIECEDCHAATAYQETMECAVGAWNRRAQP